MSPAVESLLTQIRNLGPSEQQELRSNIVANLHTPTLEERGVHAAALRALFTSGPRAKLDLISRESLHERPL